VKTDLFGGFVGDMIDWSQDHIYTNLQMIHSIAPDRVGIYGLVRQDEETKILRPIYVHSKLAIVDDERIITGSTNMDNMSFFYSSELSLSITSPQLARETRVRLMKEHLGTFYKPEMETDFQLVMDTFKQVATMNDTNLRAGLGLSGRPVFMVPTESYEVVLKRIFYPNKIFKLLYKLGINTEDAIQRIAENGKLATDYLNSLSFWKRSKM